MRLAVLVLCFLLATPLAASAQTPSPLEEAQFKASGHEPIDGVHVKEMLLGNTTYGVMLQGNRSVKPGGMTVDYFRDASRVVRLNANKDTGKRYEVERSWWVDGNSRCIKSQEGKVWLVHCSTLYDLGGLIYLCEHGHCGTVIRIVPGNPEKL
jgi:hypothetical protein